MSWVQDMARQHKTKEGVANLFGVIMYTDAHPHVKKILRDDDYWAALDDLSGPRWSIFSVRVMPGRREFPPPPPDSFSFMVPVWREPASNKELLSVFQLDSTEQLPKLIVFAEDEQGDIHRSTIDIDDSSELSAYTSLKEAISKVATAVDYVSTEYLKENVQAFYAVKRAIDDHKQMQVLRHGLNLWQYLMSIK